MSVAVDMKALFEAGVHFGHKTKKIGLQAGKAAFGGACVLGGYLLIKQQSKIKIIQVEYTTN